MVNMPVRDMIKLAGRGSYNYITNRPLVVSYEITLSCVCNCRHCNLGGIIKNEKRIVPSEYARLARSLKAPVVQISGGEPLLRKDVIEIIKAIKQNGGNPYIILVSNGVLLNKDNYLQLREAGVNQFSVSLDFPDERHDDFRRHPGLYKHLEQTIPKIADFGYKDIILNTAITSANLPDLIAIAKKAEEWKVSVSYSAYTALRTGDKNYSLRGDDSLNLLRQTIKELITLKGNGYHITNSKAVLLDTVKFFEKGYTPNCKAGIRFFCVMPDGAFVPCPMHRQRYSTQKKMIGDFSRSNQCGGCYTSIRAYSDGSLVKLLKDVPSLIKQIFKK